MAKATTKSKSKTTKKAAAKATKKSATKAAKKAPSKKKAKGATSAKAAKKAGAASKKSAARAEASKKPSAETAAADKQPPAETAPQPDNTLEDVALPATGGKLTVFGGPKDRGIKPDDMLKLPTGPHFAYERVYSLNPKGYYCAMRWDYNIPHKSPEEAKRWWANKRLLVTNPKNNSAVVVRAVDYGPHENTGCDIGLSPGAAQALGVEAGDEVTIAFANQKAPLGPVTNSDE